MASGPVLSVLPEARDEMKSLSVKERAKLLSYVQDRIEADEDTIGALKPLCDPVGNVEAFHHESGGVEMIYGLYVQSPDYVLSGVILYVGHTRGSGVDISVLAEKRLRMFVQ